MNPLKKLGPISDALVSKAAGTRPVLKPMSKALKKIKGKLAPMSA